ncbi:MFS transporter [Halorussus salilacus]|uniref:MFS transporter n=1 Tax=Halorussus salilacus TaxID=2953750 RepID=UPI00209CD99C|nr:MFS transporter [Halorussus salilacus]USZ67404.1 MFS transporter [Halorussus salilacus]
MPIGVADRLGSLRRLGRELWSGGRGPVLAAVAGGWFLSLGVRMIYPAVLPQLREAYTLDLTTAGLLITALWVAYALGQLPGGILDDWLGGGRTLVASTVVSALALAFVVVADSVAVLFGATLLFGFATALYGVARFTILTTTYPERGGTAIGLTMAAGDLGNSLLPPLAGALAVALAWQLGFGLAIPLLVVAAVGIHVVVPSDASDSRPEADATGDGANSRGAFDTIRRIGGALWRRPVALVVAIQTLSYCVWQAFTGFYPTYLVEVKELAPTTSTVLFGGFFALGILVKPLAGSAYDARGLRRVLPVVLVALTASLVALPLVDGLVGIIAVTALASSLLGYGTITLTYLTDAFPDDVQGTGLGALRTGYMLVGAGSPTVMGALADMGYFDEAFFLLAGVGAVTAVLSVLVPEG